MMGNGFMDSGSFDGGERKELEVKDRDFGMIVIGDRGELRYKGTRFLEFVRVMEA
ncbi:MAG: DUF2500 family protein [Bacillota bacterium]